MHNWVRAGDVFSAIKENVGVESAKLVLLERFHQGLLVAKITRLVRVTESNMFGVDLDAYNAEQKRAAASEGRSCEDYEFPLIGYSAQDDVILDKDSFPEWFGWDLLNAPERIWSSPRFNRCVKANWDSGEFCHRYYYRLPFTEKDDGDYSETIAAGVFFRSDLVDIIEEARGKPKAQSQDVGPSVGGRPAANHGQIIAETALRLASLNESQLKAYKSSSLSEELKAAYLAHSEAPPSERNRENYASGILRVLRARNGVS